MKKLLMTVLIIAMGIFVVACGSDEDTDPKEDESKTEITIAAAASLENVFKEEIIPKFEEKNKGIKVLGTYDASGKLQTQIEEGATIDLFFSAATKQMDTLEGKNLIDKDSVVNLLENQVVLIASKDFSNENIKDFKDIQKVNKIAIGDPKSVPAGQYAKEAFENLGIWNTLKSKEISYGTNVTEVLNWVAEGSADLGVVYKSDALSMKDKVKIIAEAPKGSVTKCIYPVGIVTSSKEKDAANKFIEFLKTDQVIKIFEEYGFKSNI